MQDSVTQVAFEGLADEREATFERVDAEIADKGDDGFPIRPIIDHTWKTWLEATSALQNLGVPPRAMCDAVNTMSEARREAAQSIDEHASA